MQFTTNDLEIIRDALGGYECNCNCGEDDSYWESILALRNRVVAEIESIDSRGLPRLNSEGTQWERPSILNNDES